MEPVEHGSMSANAAGAPRVVIPNAPPTAPILRKSRRPTVDARGPCSQIFIVALLVSSDASPPNHNPEFCRTTEANAFRLRAEYNSLREFQVTFAAVDVLCLSSLAKSSVEEAILPSEL